MNTTRDPISKEGRDQYPWSRPASLEQGGWMRNSEGAIFVTIHHLKSGNSFLFQSDILGVFIWCEFLNVWTITPKRGGGCTYCFEHLWKLGFTPQCVFEGVNLWKRIVLFDKMTSYSSLTWWQLADRGKEGYMWTVGSQAQIWISFEAWIFNVLICDILFEEICKL